jgi:hypothetical protein
MDLYLPSAIRLHDNFTFTSYRMQLVRKTGTNVSKESTTPIFRLENRTVFQPEDGGNIPSKWWFLCTNLHDTASQKLMFILWHAEPLLGNDREIDSYTTAAAR